MLSDFLIAARSLRKNPLFVLTAVFTLALGLGVNAAMFAILDGLVLRGLPFFEPGRLVHYSNNVLAEGINNMAMSAADFAELRAQQTACEDLSAYRERTFNLSGPGGDAERVAGCVITPAGLRMLGQPVQLGRWLTADDERSAAPLTVVIGDTLWRNRYKADPAVVGTQIRINSQWATIVGVAPEKFRFPSASDAWMPLRLAVGAEKRDNRYLQAFGRLKSGITLGQARAEAAAVGARLEQDHRDTNARVGIAVKPLRDQFVDGGTKLIAGLMFAAVFGVLLIVCANVTNLLLARASVRRREVALRTALGATRGRLVRLLLAETGLLCAAGVVVGLGLAYGLVGVFSRYIELTQPPYWMVFRIDLTSVVYSSLLAVFCALVAGLWPAWQVSATAPSEMLHDAQGATSFRLSRFTRGLVIGEVALSCLMLIMATLTIRSVVAVQSADLGYRTEGIFTARIGLPEATYQDETQNREFHRLLLERLAAQPEISAAALASLQPTQSDRTEVRLEDAGSAAGRVFGNRIAVSADYFGVLGISLQQGRLFDVRDQAGSPKVALVSANFAARNWPRQNPVGRAFRFVATGDAGRAAELVTVIGVVAPTQQGEFAHGAAQDGQIYVPDTQGGEMRYCTVFVTSRTGGTDSLAGVVRRTVATIDADLPIYWPQTIAAMVRDTQINMRLVGGIFIFFGAVALLLSVVGLYGVVSYSVSQRTQEIGVRVALGATPRDILVLVLGQGGRQLGTGLGIGLALALPASWLLASALYRARIGDPVAFGGAVLALGGAGLVATLVPALRAVRVNPIVALRNE